MNLNGCIQCGRCSGGCPVSIKSALNVRKLVYSSLEASIKTTEMEALGIWECTACTTCNERCPKDVKPANLIVEMRSRLVENGRMAKTVQDALESTYVQGNPWSRAREKRMEWAVDLDIPVLGPGDKADVLLFVCCTSCYDPRCQDSARAVVRLLREAGVDFGVLGEAENCCSSEQSRMGEQGLFEELAAANTAMLNERDIKQIVTVSPHCFNALKNEYPGLEIPVLHYTQLLARLLDGNRLRLPGRVDQRLTYHDPCFLGKQNKVFDEPRRLLQEVCCDDCYVEFDRCRETSLCCEGGGGRMWIESEGSGRLAETRVRDAVAMGAWTIATACPFCTLTLEDAVKTTDSEDKIRIREISEILVDAL